MSVTLDGRKIGKMTVNRDVDGDRVSTSQVIEFRLARWTTALPVRNELRSVESSRGEPLEFHAKTMSSGQETVVDGHPRPDGVFQISTTLGGQSKVSLLNWPTGATLSEGQRLAIANHGFQPGSKYQLHTFDPVKQQVAAVDIEVIGDEYVDMPLGRETLHHLRQTLIGGKDNQAADMWVDDHGQMRRSVTPMLGNRLEIAACDEACANAPDQDVDVLRATMVGSPRALPARLGSAPMRYTIAVSNGQRNPFIDTDEQQVTPRANDVYDITVNAPQPDGGEAHPTAADTAPNPWVQSTAPQVVDLAKKIVGDANTDLQRMRRLRSYLTNYLRPSGMDVGYATAVETIENGRGDCTEHAVLLTALARSLGIPARVVSGLVYADRYAGATRVFVPHTWAQAWIDDRWVSFDSAERRFDSTHIALGVGDGDPWHFYSAINVLGSLSIKEATAPPTSMRAPPTSREPPIERNNNNTNPTGGNGGNKKN